MIIFKSHHIRVLEELIEKLRVRDRANMSDLRANRSDIAFLTDEVRRLTKTVESLEYELDDLEIKLHDTSAKASCAYTVSQINRERIGGMATKLKLKWKCKRTEAGKYVNV